jgi:hypothetical protein
MNAFTRLAKHIEYSRDKSTGAFAGFTASAASSKIHWHAVAFGRGSDSRFVDQ